MTKALSTPRCYRQTKDRTCANPMNDPMHNAGTAGWFLSQLVAQVITDAWGYDCFDDQPLTTRQAHQLDRIGGVVLPPQGLSFNPSDTIRGTVIYSQPEAGRITNQTERSQ